MDGDKVYPPCISCGGRMVTDGFGTGKCLTCRARDTAGVLHPSVEFGECARCKTPLRFSTIPTGNCQPENEYEVHLRGRAVGSSPDVYFHGCAAPFSWRGRLCDRCRMGLFDFLSGCPEDLPRLCPYEEVAE